MVSRELNEVFEYINESVRYLRGLKEDESIDSIDFNFDKIMSIYDNMLAEIDYAFDSELQIDRETRTDKNWNLTKLEDCIEDINDWQIPSDLFNEDDKEEFQFLKNEYVAEWNELFEELDK